MDQLSLLEKAKNQGYIIGSSAIINSLQKQFYKYCSDNQKPYITISTRIKYSNFSVDTPNTNLRLNDNGVGEIRRIMEQYIDAKGNYSIERERIFHDTVLISVAEKLAVEMVEIFKNKDNIE